MQTKRQSLVESIANTFTGFVISFASTFLIFPLMGFESTTGKNLIITVFFTGVSIIRNYILRRVFNRKN